MQTSEEACISALQLAESQLGHSPTSAEFSELGLVPSPTTIERVFGSWNVAKEAAGLETTPYSRTEAECLEALRAVATTLDTTHLTIHAYEAHRSPDQPSFKTIYEKFDSWMVANEQALEADV